MTNADYANELALLANPPTQTDTLLDSLKQTAGNIDLYVNSDETEFMWNHRHIKWQTS